MLNSKACNYYDVVYMCGHVMSCLIMSCLSSSGLTLEKILGSDTAHAIKAANKHGKVLHLHSTAPQKQTEVHVEPQPSHLRTTTRSMSQQTHGGGQ